MKIQKLFIALIFFTAFGCASMQNPVDDNLLAEATSPEKEALAKIEKSIIAKKAEKDTAETVLAVSRFNVEINKAELSSIEAQKQVILKKEALASFTKDPAQQNTARQLTAASDAQKKKETANQNYCLAKVNSDEAGFEVKEAELSVLVAQLDYEKAKIARAYQIKRIGEKAKGLLEITNYEEYLNSQVDKLTSKKQTHLQLLDVLKKVEESNKQQGVQ